LYQNKELLMIERICPACRFGNTIDSHYCNKCGSSLERLVLAKPEATTALTLARHNLPINWKQLGTTVAIGAAAMAAEVGLAWLRRRTESGAAAAPLAKPGTALPQRDARIITTIISQRVIEIFDHGDGKRTITDNHTWRKIDE
jgi:hypothetical protein